MIERVSRAVLLVALIAVPSVGAATPIDLFGFGVVPGAPTEDDVVALRGTLLYSTSGYFVDTTQLTASSHAFSLDVTVSAPAPGDPVLDVLESEGVDVSLGQLPAGEYTWLVTVFAVDRAPLGEPPFANPPPANPPYFVGSSSGSFTVVPEPGAFVLLALAAAALRLRRCPA